LAGVGFDTVVNQTAAEPLAATTVRYAPGSEHAAALVARHLTSRAVLVADDNLEPLRIRLVTGADFSTVVRQPWSEDAVPLPTTTTTTTTPPGSAAPSTTATTAPTTTTSVIGVIPDSPPPGVTC
jgi:hypothetical protein